MGLDQYGGILNEKGEFEEIAYWRKHPNLNGFMENLYFQKGGTGEFNDVLLELTLEDISLLEAHVEEDMLPDTQGFFFGESSGNDDEIEYDLTFCERAYKEIEAGKTVVYSCWW